jgi:single-stranded-DNA-specific exonuclease
MSVPLPDQRWQIHEAHPHAEALADELGVLPLVAQVLLNRKLAGDDARSFLHPEAIQSLEPVDHFPGLAESVEILVGVIDRGQKIAICGDYDADGMTSTALLLRAFRFLGATADYAIPSRMDEGYGINRRIVQEFHEEGVGVLITVDNGIAAYDPIAYARELGLDVIITDHHDLPEKLPPANTILNPKQLPLTSPYRGLAGVGVAYVLAMALVDRLGRVEDFAGPLLELYTLGTIADLAPLVGVNRAWVRQGLTRLPQSEILGVRELIEVSGISRDDRLRPEDIGFRLGPRINAIGRIGNPQTIIDLLTTDDPAIAQACALTAEDTNVERRTLCETIEQEAIEHCDANRVDLQKHRVLLIVQAGWHHGVIGIVASRLVERYGMPVFIGTYEGDSHIRGSVRSIPEFNVFDALEYCGDLFDRYGGHAAAGGFSLPISNFEALQQRLSEFAHKVLEPEHLKPLVIIDGEATLDQVDEALYDAIDQLNPWGIGNPEPVFWSRNIRIVEQKRVGANHLKLTLAQQCGDSEVQIKAIAWRWADYNLPGRLDLAYRLKENSWKGNITIELELLGARRSEQSVLTGFRYADRDYRCILQPHEGQVELRIRNESGQVLVIPKGTGQGVMGADRASAKPVDIQLPFFRGLVRAALQALDGG